VTSLLPFYITPPTAVPTAHEKVNDLRNILKGVHEAKVKSKAILVTGLGGL
jgi:hypothetical protein